MHVKIFSSTISRAAAAFFAKKKGPMHNEHFWFQKWPFKQGVLMGTTKFSFYERQENFKKRTTLKKILKNSKIHNF